MEDKSQHRTDGRDLHPGSNSSLHWVSDCWLMDVMPPTWAWAYRQLLNAGQTPAGTPDRIA